MEGRTPFIDALSTEIRIRIYKEVLKSRHGLIPAHKDFKREVRFDVSLLTTCKVVYAEALDVFFEVNVVRFWRRIELDNAVKDNLRCLAFIRHLELVNVTSEWHWLRANAIPTTMDTCKKFPRLRTLTISFDALSTYHRRAYERGLKELLAATTITDELQCVDVGVYILKDSAGPQIYFKHFGMIKAWREVKRAQKVNLKTTYNTYANQLLGYKAYDSQA